ncbi:hypothetical protein M9H77_19969 [Catharanthus roseus]|uniref:Uncharacterized protein n=1 Tax=Catharanthus roseus TaxID=4058 RepID=A0ACC0AMB9_CATRO|nr:hypothetical protein M9H77_19969 [Catharanthus roseus]
MASNGPSWADQWGGGSGGYGDEGNDKGKTARLGGGTKMTEVKAVASAGFDKAKAAAAVGAKKVKSGTAGGIKWVKAQYEKRKSSSK